MTAFCVVTAANAPLAHAQLAPGDNQATRASDTGYASGVGAHGNYSTQVPIDLPEARGGIPIPFSITYSGRGAGAAGLGWHIPLSFVRVDRTWQRRRPSRDAAPAGREQVTVSLAGQSMLMTKSDSIWVARRDALDYELSFETATNTWKLVDGGGREYRFAHGSLGTVEDGIWLLTSIASTAQVNRVELSWRRIGNAIDGMEIELEAIRYNSHPTTANCFKHEVLLSYNAALASPLGVSFGTTAPLLRTRTLSRVDVKARTSCSVSTTLRAYTFEYTADPDTGVQGARLKEVLVSGRSGTPEFSTQIQVATYEYAAATDPALAYVAGPDISFPSEITGTPMFAISTVDPGASSPGGGPTTVSWDDVIDMTGDGRPDLVFKRNGQLGIAVTRPMSTGAASFTTSTPVSLSSAVYANRPLSSSSSTVRRYTLDSQNQQDAWRQVIDMNGDGRLDIVDASEVAGKWVAYLNTPGSAAAPVVWKRLEIDVSGLRTRLTSTPYGHVIATAQLPLSRRRTGYDLAVTRCYLNRVERPCTPQEHQAQQRQGYEKTFTEWEVRDANGDGYPDVLFNSAPATWYRQAEPTDDAVQRRREVFWPKPGTRIEVALNTLGVRITSSAMFSAPVVLVTSSFDPDTEACGVGLWRGSMDVPDPFDPADPDQQVQVCGFVDVNGDGLLDRLSGLSATVRLGTGMGLSPRSLTLPGTIAHRNPRDSVCAANPAGSYVSEQTAGLRDLTGDGVPDYLRKQRDPSTGATYWELWPGTGTGFAPSPHRIDFSGFALNEANESCNLPGDSHTRRGLYDIDGDGKPEVIAMKHSPSRLEVYHLQGLPGRQSGRPDAGRLIAVGNGAGAHTIITYRSAKRDPLTEHQVPFPEIVVNTMTTMGLRQLGGTLAETRYAYGGAKLFFDPALDRFTMRSYLRVIEASGVQKDGAESQFATVRDYYDLPPFAGAPSTDAERFHRYQLVGRLRSSTRLGYGVAFDPWTLLATTALGTTKQLTAEEQTHATRYVALATSDPDPINCLDVMFPYDWGMTLSANIGRNACAARGLTYVSDAKTWTGAGFAMGTRVAVTNVDDRGNVLEARDDGDVNRSDDDTCITQTFAQPSAGKRVFHALATREINNCKSTGAVIYSRDTFEYDALAIGAVSLGRTTSHSVERRETVVGTLLATVRDFVATYDGMGNLATIRAARAEDGALRTVTLTYEEWGLVPSMTRVTAGGAPALQTVNTLHAATLAVTKETDANGTERGTVRDGFDRVTQTTLRPPGTAPAGITSVASYANFTVDSIEPRRVTTTTYPEPIAPANLATAEGTTITTELDELGRTHQVREALGADYGDTLVSHRTYDPLGRVSFVSDAHPQSALPPLPYGTSYHYAGDGEIDCEIRGYGPVARVAATNLATELLPTCVTRTFVANKLQVATSTPDALQAGTPQNGVTTVSTYTATGRLLQSETFKSGTRLELLQYTHDVLGHTRSLVRYGSPAGGTPSLPTTWSWTYDSLGQVLTASEPEVATRTNTFSSFGELRSVEWTDTTAFPARAMRLEYTYDALGRKLSSVERQDGGAIPKTAYTWTYDTSAGSPHLTSVNALGRLTKTSSEIGDMLVSYDATGQVSARTYVAEGLAYHERFGNRLDGSLAWLELALPDNSYATEHVDYGYDSAQRLRSIMAGATALYGATTIDVLGRVRAAELGDNTHYTASYQEVGRRLPLSETYELTSGRRRTTLYQSFDAMGRELVRREDSNGAAGTTSTQTYTALGHLGSSRDTRVKLGATITVANHTFTTDALGNATSAVTTNGSSVVTSERRATHSATDRDRMCRLDYGPATAGQCNVLHDGAGNIRQYSSRSGATRTLTFYPSGPVRQIQQGSIIANFRYDGSGFIDELDLGGTGAIDPRTDRRFGLTQRRTVTTAGVPSSILVRSIPGPGGGTIAMRRGAVGPWIYAVGDSQGTRRTFDDGTEVVQEISYTPFGVATSSGPAPTSATYTRHQWNGGDALADFGLVLLGARVYDPQLSRFLSRDPLLIPRSAAKVNPYAFAWNDPINFADPTGLDPRVEEPRNCDGVCIKIIADANRLLDWVTSLPTPEQAREQEFRELREILDANGPLSFVEGVAEGVYDAAAGVVTAVSHPVQTVEGIGHAIANPVETAGAIKDAAVNVVRAVENRDWRAFGNAVGQIGASAIGGGAALSLASKGAAKIGLRVGARGASAFARPKGVPSNWVAKPSKTGGGTRFVDPANPHNSVRIMPGDPSSPFPNSRKPYVRHVKDGRSLDVNGNVVPKNTPDAHIPLDDFVWPF